MTSAIWLSCLRIRYKKSGSSSTNRILRKPKGGLRKVTRLASKDRDAIFDLLSQSLKRAYSMPTLRRGANAPGHTRGSIFPLILGLGGRQSLKPEIGEQ